MKHESCRTCRFYWEPDCRYYPIPCRVYSPSHYYCEYHKPNDPKKK